MRKVAKAEKSNDEKLTEFKDGSFCRVLEIAQMAWWMALAADNVQHPMALEDVQLFANDFVEKTGKLANDMADDTIFNMIAHIEETTGIQVQECVKDITKSSMMQMLGDYYKVRTVPLKALSLEVAGQALGEALIIGIYVMQEDFQFASWHIVERVWNWVDACNMFGLPKGKRWTRDVVVDYFAERGIAVNKTKDWVV